MTENTKGVHENVEETPGSVLNARDAMVKAAPTSLGPADLCVVFKEFYRPFVPTAFQSNTRYVYYHHVLGLDASSAAAVAAYFGDMVNHQEPAATLSPSRYRLVGGLYCSYDALSKVDLRVEFSIPGGVKAYVVDRAGSKQQPTDEHWHRVSLCNYLRYVCGPDPPAHTLTAVRLLHPLQSPAAEQRFLALARLLYREGMALGTEVGGVGDVSVSRLALGVKRYFVDMRRYQQGIAFFGQLSKDDAAVIAHAADIYATLGYASDALKALADAEQLRPNAPSLLTAHALICLEEGMVEDAIKYATAALRAARDRPAASFVLARSYIALKDYASAILVLNSAHVREAAQPSLPQVKPLRITQPSGGAAPPPPAPAADDDPDDPLPASRLRGPLKEAYEVLVELLMLLGWDGLLDTRSAVFVMEGETAQLEEVTAAAAAGAAAAATPPTVGAGHDPAGRSDTAGRARPGDGSDAERAGGAARLPSEVRRALQVLGLPADVTEAAATAAFREQMDEDPSPLLVAAGAALARHLRFDTLLQVVKERAAAAGIEMPSPGTQAKPAAAARAESVAATGVDAVRESATAGAASAATAACAAGAAGGVDTNMAAPAAGSDAVTAVAAETATPAAETPPDGSAEGADSAAESADTAAAAEARSAAPAAAAPTGPTAATAESETGSPAKTEDAPASETEAAAAPATAPGEVSGGTDTAAARAARPDTPIRRQVSFKEPVDSESADGGDASAAAAGSAAKPPTEPKSDAEPPSAARLARLTSTQSVSDGTATGRRKKVLCQRWMDVLFHALYEDLSAYSRSLRAREAQEAAAAAAAAAASAPASGTGAAAAGASGAPATASGTGAASASGGGSAAPAAAAAAAAATSASATAAPATEATAAAGTVTPQPPPTPPPSARDWVRLGRLSERLHRLADAERAYRNAVASVWDYRGWAGLLSLYARGGYTREALVAAEQILRWWDMQVGGADPKEEQPIGPQIVSHSIYQLIAVHGLQAVRDAQAALGPPHAAINNLFHEAVRWHVHGFDM